jgi:uncharacterized protein YjbI with pentapeptide repeats
MKAEEVLERYQAGERNFQRVNLRGQSFKGKDLSGADFSEADIQGANFTKAILKGVNFSYAKSGLQKRWVIILLIVSSLLSTLSGFISAIASFLLVYFFLPENIKEYTILPSVVSLVVFAIFFIVTIRQGPVAGAGAVAFAFAFAFAFALLSAYIGWRALAGDEKHAFIKNIAIAFAATGGTNFRGADLTDANFTKATLKNTNFREANLTRTRFYEAQKLNLARVDNTILTIQAVLRLLVSGNGRGKSYVDANLRGANLIGADLKEANLKNADISEATFQGACLEWANLTLTQAVGTNFTSAQMTGACVEAWNIEHTTILDSVDCRLIYLLENPKPGTDERERRPSSGEFKPGEFTKLFQEVFDTVDLIFRNGIDWKAFVAAFKTGV